LLDAFGDRKFGLELSLALRKERIGFTKPFLNSSTHIGKSCT